MKFEIRGGADERTVAAILAAVARLDDERSTLPAVPRTSLRQSLWVTAGRPRPMQRVHATEEPHSGAGWSVGGVEDDVSD